MREQLPELTYGGTAPHQDQDEDGRLYDLAATASPTPRASLVTLGARLPLRIRLRNFITGNIISLDLQRFRMKG